MDLNAIEVTSTNNGLQILTKLTVTITETKRTASLTINSKYNTRMMNCSWMTTTWRISGRVAVPPVNRAQPQRTISLVTLMPTQIITRTKAPEMIFSLKHCRPWLNWYKKSLLRQLRTYTGRRKISWRTIAKTQKTAQAAVCPRPHRQRKEICARTSPERNTITLSLFT